MTADRLVIIVTVSTLFSEEFGRRDE